jgi:periplasmic protein TonB
MNSVLEGGAHLERELTPEPMGRPAAGALALHATLAAGIIFYGILSGLFHHNLWGNPGTGGAMSVSLVSALPLPADQAPNQNVLSTETPSQAPALPSPKTKQMEDLKAVPILGKQTKRKREMAHKTPPHQPPPKADNLAQYGEQAGSSMPRMLQTQGGSSVATTTGGDFSHNFGWYVDQINRVMSSNWYEGTVDQRTPKGSRAYITFTIHADGSPSDVQLDRSSGSPTLDQSCLNAARRVQTFGSLPNGYNQSTLRVSFYCEY